MQLFGSLLLWSKLIIIKYNTRQWLYLYITQFLTIVQKRIDEWIDCYFFVWTFFVYWLDGFFRARCLSLTRVEFRRATLVGRFLFAKTRTRSPRRVEYWFYVQTNFATCDEGIFVWLVLLFFSLAFFIVHSFVLTQRAFLSLLSLDSSSFHHRSRTTVFCSGFGTGIACYVA